jgi:superfamily II DNA helicase RecQ
MPIAYPQSRRVPLNPGGQNWVIGGGQFWVVFSKVFPDNSPYQHPETIRALFAALRVLDAYRDKPSRPSRKSDQSLSTIEHEEFELTPQQEDIYLQLKLWRSKKAQEEGIPSYVIAHNSVMKRMVVLPVTCTADLLTIKGFGEKRTRKYGEEILAVFDHTIAQDENTP